MAVLLAGAAAVLCWAGPANPRAELEAAAARAPSDPEAWRRLGFLYQSLGEAAKARGAFSRVVELRPRDAAGWYMLALTHEKLGERPQAVAAWERCLQHSADPRMSETARRHLEHLKGS